MKSGYLVIDLNKYKATPMLTSTPYAVIIKDNELYEKIMIAFTSGASDKPFVSVENLNIYDMPIGGLLTMKRYILSKAEQITLSSSSPNWFYVPISVSRAQYNISTLYISKED